MKKIKLTQGKVALVDDEDFEFLNQWKWYTNCKGYAARNLRVQESKNRGTLFMHLEIKKVPRGRVVDHIDENPLNNQKVNLRAATKSQNGLNRGRNKNNTSGFKGVQILPGPPYKKRYRAYLKDKKGQTVYCGSYHTAEEAHKAYQKAAKKHHGEFAKW
jgi:hypothetical protein